jgi:hypothetical protein
VFKVNELVKIYLGPTRSLCRRSKSTYSIGLVLNKNESIEESYVYEILVDNSRIYMIDHYIKKI